MDKSFLLTIILSFCALFSITPTAQAFESNESYLVAQIQSLELKKKELIKEFRNSKQIRDDAVTKAANLLMENNDKIYSTPYRMAELEEDGITPASFAINGRNDAYKNIKNQIIENCKEEIKNSTKLYSKINELKDVYNNIKPSDPTIVNTLGKNVVVTYGKYSGADIGWKIDLTVNTPDVRDFNISSFLSYKDLTGENPPSFGDSNYTAFCDAVEYYDNLFKTGKSPLVFEVTYSFNFDNLKNLDNAGYIDPFYKYNINFESLVFYSKDKNDNKKQLPMEDYCITREIESAYNIEERFLYFENLERIIYEKIYDICSLKTIENPSMPVALPIGINGSGGTNCKYVLFGLWPQSIKKEDVTIKRAKEVNINGWTCYEGSDDNYYVRLIATPFEKDYKFSDNTSLIRGKEYYFKMESIKWRVLSDNFQNGKLLLSENVLDAKSYDDYWNNYIKSDIRTWLNEEFLLKAFAKEAVDKINTVIVDNSEKSFIDSNNSFETQSSSRENTNDKVFLLSLNEATRDDFGFSGYEEKDDKRIRTNTDYARAKGVVDKTEHTSWWWMRSSGDIRSDYVRNVNNDGDASKNSLVSLDQGGVVPALVVTY